MDQRYGSEVWNRGMERILQGGMERGYGTGVWNGCGPGACSGPPILTCPHIYAFPQTLVHHPSQAHNSRELASQWPSRLAWIVSEQAHVHRNLSPKHCKLAAFSKAPREIMKSYDKLDKLCLSDFASCCNAVGRCCRCGKHLLSYLSSWTAQPLAMTGPPEALQQIWPKYLPVQTMDCILTYHHYCVILCVLYMCIILAASCRYLDTTCLVPFGFGLVSLISTENDRNKPARLNIVHFFGWLPREARLSHILGSGLLWAV